MSLNAVCNFLVFKVWWAYPPEDNLAYGILYHLFNLSEGLVWLGCAGYVAARYWRNRFSPLEVWYAGAFILFGCTDFWEAYQLTSWLLWLKLLNLIALLKLSMIVKRRLYPTAKML